MNNYMSVTDNNNECQYGAYGHDFKTIEEAKTYLEENGGGTIYIFNNETLQDEPDNSYQPTRINSNEALIVVDTIGKESQFVAVTTIGQGTGNIFLAASTTPENTRDAGLDAIITDWTQANIYDVTKRKNIRIITIKEAKKLGYDPQPMINEEDTTNFGDY